MSTEDILNLIKQFIEGAEREYNAITKELNIKELEQQDLLHELEISSLNASEMAKVAKRLRQTRLERRSLKNDFERIKIIKHFTDKQIERKLLLEIKTLVNELNNLKSRQENCKYRPRVLKDLKCGGNK